MNKVELKHLAPYLPFGLMACCIKDLDKGIKNEHTGQVVELSHKSNHGDWARVKFDDCYTVMYSGYNDRFSNFHDYFIKEDIIKPLLMPLSFMLEDIICEQFFEDESELLGDDFSAKNKAKNFIQADITQICEPLWFWELCYKLHIDIYGLINAGLALNKKEYAEN